MMKYQQIKAKHLLASTLPSSTVKWLPAALMAITILTLALLPSYTVAAESLKTSLSSLSIATSSKPATENATASWKQPEFLPAEQAFIYQSLFEPKSTPATAQISFNWNIVAGYYLYQDSFALRAYNPNTGKFDPDNTLLQIGPAQFSRDPEIKFDPNFDKEMAIYHNQLSVSFPIQTTNKVLAESGVSNLQELINKQQMKFQLKFQGCAEKGLCYPLQRKVINAASLFPWSEQTQTAMQTAVQEKVETIFQKQVEATGVRQKDIKPATDPLAKLLADASLVKLFFIFLLLGIGLCLTPCVLPMVPIISSIVMGQEKQTSSLRAFTLSSTYVLAMTCTYTVVGVIAALFGAKANLQILMQEPAVLISFSLLFVLLSLSMFGLYELNLPQTLTNKINAISQNQNSGSYVGAFIMGMLSAIVVSPCVSAPLAGALVYISSTGDVMVGGTALFALGLGMGLPLIALCTFGVNILPKAGIWLNSVKKIFGIMLLGVALWLLARIIEPSLSLALWAGLAVFSSISLGLFAHDSARQHPILKTFCILLLIWGLLMLIGAALGNSNPFQPLANLQSKNQAFTIGDASHAEKPVAMKVITTPEELTDELAISSQQNRISILDFYADWCISCIEIEHEIFNNPALSDELSRYRLIQADLSSNSPESFQLLEDFNLFGPPAILFFDKTGKELAQYRIQGTVTAEKFTTLLQEMGY